MIPQPLQSGMPVLVELDAYPIDTPLPTESRCPTPARNPLGPVVAQ